jgi:hypothetical protein
MNNHIIRFTFSNSAGTLVDIDYRVFDISYSKLWLKSLIDNIDSEVETKMYGFSNSRLDSQINKVNLIIDKLNSKIGKNIVNYISPNNIESDVNYVHRHFVDNDQQTIIFNDIDSNLWSQFNSELHGLEILSRSKNESKKQIFVALKKQDHYDLPKDAYRYFSIRKVFGYCYANYAHIGRHLFEIYLANDVDIDRNHFVPMSKINGSCQLWFGNTTPWIYSVYEKNKIKKWYKEYNLKDKTSKEWGDPTLSLGWLPVAKIVSKINKAEVENLKDLIKISYVE